MPVVELLLELVLDERALLLDDDQFVQPLGEPPHALRLQRPGHGDLVDGEADLARQRRIDAQTLQGLPDVEIALADGPMPKRCRGASWITRSRRLARAKARAASRLCRISRSSWTS